MAKAATELLETRVGILCTPLETNAAAAYFDGLCVDKGLRVAETARGRALFATRAFAAGEQVLRERPLVAIQHKRNRKHAKVCACCLRYVGSVEMQIAGRLLYPADGGWRSDSDEEETDLAEAEEEDSEEEEEEEDVLDEDENSEEERAGDVSELDISPSLLKGMLYDWTSTQQRGPSEAAIPAESKRTLPHAHKFDSPAPVRCAERCGEAYCSSGCRDRHWHAHHRLLCTRRNGATAAHHRHADNARCAADDVLHVAAQCLALTLLRAKQLVGDAPTDDQLDWCALQAAWAPFAMGCKQLWWKDTPVPPHVPVEDHVEYRKRMEAEVRESCELLGKAMRVDDVERFAPLFAPEVMGNLLGMFELNNLAVLVASPTENFFVEADGANKAADESTEPPLDTLMLLAALGDDYQTPCEGTGFYALQSCCNHSCVPAAEAVKSQEHATAVEVAGDAVLVATRDIVAGEEVTISYVDEAQTLEERRVALDGYGFRCDCSKCAAEAEANRKGKGKARQSPKEGVGKRAKTT